ncbi:MAG: hypothetical protein WCT49_06020 [Candidatus Paceibacterota bacterium]|nr:hypothetical protein [Candidatus Paceibacterota bacterium]
MLKKDIKKKLDNGNIVDELLLLKGSQSPQMRDAMRYYMGKERPGADFGSEIRRLKAVGLGNLIDEIVAEMKAEMESKKTEEDILWDKIMEDPFGIKGMYNPADD